ncbi:DUF805 domain-containing protein [Marinivivus vitaminiproducens]|uniref:DUF805 domain-containing protein n=1 Tax=Marinivivus vitaminiproducens TaxID=3035935 RepID=UPI00279EE1B0|nr:DUF805 domain-containing protein [Geminicoccaceae bacterium SCSIO 64248]
MFTFQGRRGRLSYLGACILLGVAFAVVYLAPYAAGIIDDPSVWQTETTDSSARVDAAIDLPEESGASWLWGTLLSLAFLVPSLSVLAQRYHDMNISGIWPGVVSGAAGLHGIFFTDPDALSMDALPVGVGGYALAALLFASFVVGLIALLIPGTREPNDFGETA